MGKGLTRMLRDVFGGLALFIMLYCLLLYT